LSSSPTRTFPPSESAAATSVHCSREMPITPHWCGTGGTCSAMWARLRAVGRIPPVTPITQETCSGGSSAPMSSSGSRLARWPESKHSCSGLTPASRIAPSSARIVSNEFSNTAWNTKSLRRREYFA
jgi:hypothetical protein